MFRRALSTSVIALVGAMLGLVVATPISAASGQATRERPTVVAQEWRPLIELRTADNSGTFYTISDGEAGIAVSRHGFRRTDEASGLRLHPEPGAGTVALHRLRQRVGHQTYLVSADPAEIGRLSAPNDPNRRFDDEGILAHAYGNQRPGTMALHRFSRNGDWRLARAGRADLIAAGYHDDGPVGWIPEG